MKEIILMLAGQKALADIVSLLRQGVDVRKAYDTVLGAGAYERLVGELYDELRAKAA